MKKPKPNPRDASKPNSGARAPSDASGKAAPEGHAKQEKRGQEKRGTASDPSPPNATRSRQANPGVPSPGERPDPRRGTPSRTKPTDDARTDRTDEARPQAKDEALEPFRERHAEGVLTTDQGIPISHTDDSLKAGLRGPTLLEDFHLREKLTRFDHERIPERVVHARGSGAHGFFQLYESLDDLTRANFLCDTAARTPVFVRFSTVVGSRGSSDLARDVRGFATRFYTRDGNFDLVGNNMPVFFIQDGIKFPDLVHAVKPEPHHEMPQAASAHDTFWDFVSLVPETMHMVMWVMSDRGLPRSYRMMEGFGVHTFRLINAKRGSVFVKFHWKPLLGAHSVLWEEAQEISGKDPDFHRRDLWEAIEAGQYPAWELGLQVIPEEDATRFGFDLLDPTKLVPEEIVPVRRVGKLTLDRNPSNFFAEVEQVAFCIANVVPGIDFTNDPLLQARLFSYLDTQLLRLGGPNFMELPINRPIGAVRNHQQDGLHRQTIHTSRALYHPNSIEGNRPELAPTEIGFHHFEEALEGTKVRARSESFGDHFSQARMFFHSQSPAERIHLIEALRFELGKVERLEIRERVVALLAETDPQLAANVAPAVGVKDIEPPARRPAGGNATRTPANSSIKPILRNSPALSLDNQPKESIATRKVAVLVASGVRSADIERVRAAIEAEDATFEIISLALGAVATDTKATIEATKTFFTTASVFYDAVYLPGGAASSATLLGNPRARQFVADAFRHFKPIGATNEGVALLIPNADDSQATDSVSSSGGIVVVRSEDSRVLDEFAAKLIAAIAQHRFFGRAVEPVGSETTPPRDPRDRRPKSP